MQNQSLLEENERLKEQLSKKSTENSEPIINVNSAPLIINHVQVKQRYLSCDQILRSKKSWSLKSTSSSPVQRSKSVIMPNLNLRHKRPSHAKSNKRINIELKKIGKEGKKQVFQNLIPKLGSKLKVEDSDVESTEVIKQTKLSSPRTLAAFSNSPRSSI